MKNKGRTDFKYEITRTDEGLYLRVYDFDLGSILGSLAISCVPLGLAYGWWHIPFQRVLGVFGLFPQLLGVWLLIFFAVTFEFAQKDELSIKRFVFKHDRLVFHRNLLGFTKSKVYPLEKIYEFRASRLGHSDFPILVIEAAGDFLIVARNIQKAAADKIITELLEAGMNPNFVTPVSQRQINS